MDPRNLEHMCQAWMQGSDDIIPRKPFHLLVADTFGYTPEQALDLVRFLRHKGYPIDVASNHSDS